MLWIMSGTFNSVWAFSKLNAIRCYKWNTAGNSYCFYFLLPIFSYILKIFLKIYSSFGMLHHINLLLLSNLKIHFFHMQVHIPRFIVINWFIVIKWVYFVQEFAPTRWRLWLSISLMWSFLSKYMMGRVGSVCCTFPLFTAWNWSEPKPAQGYTVF